LKSYANEADKGEEVPVQACYRLAGF